jgi:hypothetical protein
MDLVPDFTSTFWVVGNVSAIQSASKMYQRYINSLENAVHSSFTRRRQVPIPMPLNIGRDAASSTFMLLMIMDPCLDFVLDVLADQG